jgi:hypothetical protein
MNPSAVFLQAALAGDTVFTADCGGGEAWLQPFNNIRAPAKAVPVSSDFPIPTPLELCRQNLNQ